jgi:hypothetical protein
MAEQQEEPLFKGTTFMLCDNWIPYIQLPDGPINYCEIGVFYGANLLQFAQLFPQASLVGIDPWLDYEEYPEYKSQISSVYSVFLENLSKSPYKDNIIIHRGFSHTVMPTFPNNYFNIVYIDGNHERDFVLKDAQMAYDKTLVGGYIIFDDINWESVHIAFSIFMELYKDKVQYIALAQCQTICRKIA